jgi:hypothetical protein
MNDGTAKAPRTPRVLHLPEFRKSADDGRRAKRASRIEITLPDVLRKNI